MSFNQDYLNKRYLSNSDIDINAMMNSVTGETANGTFETLLKEKENSEEKLGTNDINNHVVFAQNIVNEVTTGKFFKSGQMFLNNITCDSNDGRLDINFLLTSFKTTQGLIELPIHTILRIGGIYDFYYYDDYNKDDKINFDLINGLKTKNGYDLLDDPIINNRHYGTYVYDDKNLTLTTTPFLKPLTPRHIDDSIANSSDLFSVTNFSKNYKDKYYDYDLGREISLSNNISSHIPFSGYGILNNYINAMSFFFFNEGLDGKKTKEEISLNDNGIPYHIIGNFKGNLKTFKTYNDTQINFLASYNNYGNKIEHDLNGLKTTLDTLTKTITLDTNFVFSKSSKKTEFFLILSKIKANYLGGYITIDFLYTIIKDLCSINNLKAKSNDVDVPDFTALLIHLLFYPDGAEKDGRRPNKTHRILSLYDVDPNSFMGVIDYSTEQYVELIDYLSDILNQTPEKQHEKVTNLLLSMWLRELNTDKSDKLSSLDNNGTYVIYPGCGGEIDLKELFSSKKNHTYHKTNNVTSLINNTDLNNSYITGLTTSSFRNYDDINNDLIEKLNFDYKKFYELLPNNTSINDPYTEFLAQKSLTSTLKYSEKKSVPNSVSDNDTAFLSKFNQIPYNGGLTTLNITNPMVTSNLDRYDDLYIVANTTNPDGIKGLNFNNRCLINNTSKLFWFVGPQKNSVFPLVEEYRSQKGEHLKDIKVIDEYEVEQFGYGDNVKKLYEWGDPLNHSLGIVDYSNFKKDRYMYFDGMPQDRIDPLIDIFGIDKLEDFRSLFKNFTDSNFKNYFNQTFGTFDFQSLIKHTNIFGYTHLPESVKLVDREYVKTEISAFLCGYSGYFIEFAAKNDVSKIINYSLTIGQENKARIVIDEFMNAKITINNYSTGGPLYVDNTINNPDRLALNSNIFNPIIMYASDIRTADSIISKLDYRLLFRTLLFGDQPINPYDIKTIPSNFDSLVEKYLGTIKIAGIEPNLSKIILPELTRLFFSTLNIEITEGNLKLLLIHIKSYISVYFHKNIGWSSYDFDHINGRVDETNRNATIFPSAEGAVNQEFDYTIGNSVITDKIVGGVLTKVGEVKYIYNTIDDFKAPEKLKEYIDYYNKITLTKQIESFNTGLTKFSELSKNKISKLNTLRDNNIASQLDELTKSQIEIRTGTYYRVKSLYDRSVSFNRIDLNDTTLIKKTSKEMANISPNDILNNPLFFNFNVETDDTDYENCSDKPIKADKNGEYLKDLYDYALVLDRGNNPYGTKVLANIDALTKVIADDITNVTAVDNTLRSKSMWSVLSTLASDHEFLLLPLTSYVNLNGVVKKSQDPFDIAHDMFGVFNNLEMFDSNPAFIFQLGSLTSNVSAGNKSKKNNLSEFDLSNTFCLDIETSELDTNGQGKILNEGIPNDILNSNISSFIVDFGNKNQNMFKNIELSTDEFANTEESIFTQVQIASEKNSVAQLSTGKLFTAMENRSYSCTVTSLGNAGIQPLTYFYIKNVPLFYGTYWITNVSHKITPNTMTTTFKGVRQPIAKKPTANTAILRQLFLTAERNAEADGFIDSNNRVPTDTDGRIYAFKNREPTAIDNGFAIFSQAESGGDYVNYSGQWISAAYLSFMTNKDENNILLIKGLIAYLYNNASTIIDDQEPKVAIKYFVDVIVYDMVNKFNRGRSLSAFLKEYPTNGSTYERLLLEFSELEINEVPAWLSTAELNGKAKTTLIANKDGKIILSGDTTEPNVTFPTQIASNEIDLRGSSYWISDKKYFNIGDPQIKVNTQQLQGFSIYELTNKMFDTNISLEPNIRGSIKEVWSPVTKGSQANITVNPKLYNESSRIIVDVYTPYRTPDGFPKVKSTQGRFGLNQLSGLAIYKKVETLNYNYKDGFGSLSQANKDLLNRAFLGDGIQLPFDTSKITVGANGDKYFITLGYAKDGVSNPVRPDSKKLSVTQNSIGDEFYSGNNPWVEGYNYFKTTGATPTILGFGRTTGTTPNTDEFNYSKSYSDPYKLTGSDVEYQADVLGAVSNGITDISFISIQTKEQVGKSYADRTVKSYINRDILGDTNNLKDWTITNIDIDSDDIYQPPRRGNNTRITITPGANEFTQYQKYPNLAAVVLEFEGGYNDYNYSTNGSKGFFEGTSPETARLFPEKLTELTVEQVLDYQKNRGLFAVGRYQMTPETFKLQFENNKYGVKKTDKFTRETQDKIGVGLWPKSVSDYIDGVVEDTTANREKAAYQIAAIWAAVGMPYAMQTGAHGRLSNGTPVPINDIVKNEGLYSGIGANPRGPAATSSDEIQTALKYERSNRSTGRTSTTSGSTSRTSSTTSGSTIVIGDSLYYSIQAANPKIKLLSDVLAKASKTLAVDRGNGPNEGGPSLLNQLKSATIHNDVKNVIVTIGANDLWNKDEINQKKAIELIKQKFPNAKYYIMNGNYGWSGLVVTSTNTDTFWRDRITNYINVFKTNGFEIIGQIVKVLDHPAPNDDFYKTYEPKLKTLA